MCVCFLSLSSGAPRCPTRPPLSVSGRSTTLLSGTGRFENLERTHECIVDSHHSTGIVELATIVRSGKDRYKLPSSKEFVSVLHHLVRPYNEVEVVSAKELADYVATECKGHTAVVFSPALDTATER